MHRFDEALVFHLFKNAKDGLFASISVGVKANEFKFIEELVDKQLVPEYITIDIAHGHSDSVIKMIKHIKIYSKTFVIAEMLVRQKVLENLKMQVQMQLKLVSDQVEFVSQK